MNFSNGARCNSAWQRLRLLANGWLKEDHLGARKLVVVNRRFAATGVIEFCLNCQEKSKFDSPGQQTPKLKISPTFRLKYGTRVAVIQISYWVDCCPMNLGLLSRFW